MLKRNSLQWLGLILVSLIFLNACVPIQPAPASDAATENTVVADAGGDEEPPERGAVTEVDLTKRLTCAELQVGQAYAVGKTADYRSDPKTWMWRPVILNSKKKMKK